MSKQSIITVLRKFQKAPAKGKMRRRYFGVFSSEMIYRTTKSENPEVTRKMVETVLRKK